MSKKGVIALICAIVVLIGFVVFVAKDGQGFSVLLEPGPVIIEDSNS